jgi:hypothetical protein
LADDPRRYSGEWWKANEARAEEQRRENAYVEAYYKGRAKEQKELENAEATVRFNERMA